MVRSLSATDREPARVKFNTKYGTVAEMATGNIGRKRLEEMPRATVSHQYKTAAGVSKDGDLSDEPGDLAGDEQGTGEGESPEPGAVSELRRVTRAPRVSRFQIRATYDALGADLDRLDGDDRRWLDDRLQKLTRELRARLRGRAGGDGTGQP
ncbi:MAG: hypothetical protein EOO70_07050 [Myxococcaceae bacterium]|nr:MAG: hypothetical protein EOO70_07050 [Myxococcaceae bacterium]